MSRLKKARDLVEAVDLRSLTEIVDRFSTRKVLVLGDFVADSFQSGDISRVSREAPVLILRHRSTQITPGGGANAANNFASLGSHVVPISAVGDDEPGQQLLEIFRAKKVDTSAIVQVPGWTTPTKTRFFAGWTHTVAQQVLRVDYEPQSVIPERSRKELRKLLTEKVKNVDAVAISDYGFQIAQPEDVRTARKIARKNLILTLDSRYRLGAFAGCGISAATPNEAEIEAWHHTVIGRDLQALERCGERTIQELKLESSLLITRGRDGMSLFERQQKPVHLPVHGGQDAVDVTGAGDTVLATYTLALACGARPLDAAHLANIAAGLVVMKRGTATVSQQELLDAIHRAASSNNADNS